MDLKIFKAYDVRGIYPTEINEEAVEQIGRAFVEFLGEGKTVVVGRDVRTSGPALFTALTKGLIDAGANVIDIGIGTTEMMYFAVANYGYDAGVMISASHNEKRYSGLKFVRAGAQAISSDTGLGDIRDIAITKKQLPISPAKPDPALPGKIQTRDVIDDYVDHLIKTFKPKNLKPFRIVANANFGMAGKVLERLIERGKLPIELIKMDFEPDGTFPKGKPDPLIAERREETVQFIQEHKPDFGVAWDADADRVFFYDEKGGFVQGYYTISILARHLLQQHPGEKILFDVRLTWASYDTVTASGGVAIEMKPGHSFIKDRMRAEGALFAGENSGHYYFRDFFGVDCGMAPLLLMLDILSGSDKPLSEIADEFRVKYPSSEEINVTVKDADEVMVNVERAYSDGAIKKIDGLSVEYPTWRFNLRKSNTEPVIRLNVEARKQDVLKNKTEELLEKVRS